MKRSVMAFAALICAAVMGISAGAYDITHCSAEWDPETDYIYYRDITTKEIVAVEYPDGRITDYVPETGTPDSEEAPATEDSVPDDPWIWWQDTEEEPDPETEEIWYDPTEYYIQPELRSLEEKTDQITAVVSLDKQWEFDGWEFYRQEWSDDVLISEGTQKQEYSSSEYSVTVTDKGLTPGESYDYRLVFYENSEWGRLTLCSARFSATTELPMYETKMLTPEAGESTLSFTAVIDSRYEADGFVVEKYSRKKWVMVEKNGELLSYYGYGDEDYNDKYDLREAVYTAQELSPMTKYKYRIRFFKNAGKNKRKYIQTAAASAYTLMQAPDIDLSVTGNKAKLSWKKVKGAEGYEVFVYVGNAGDHYDEYGWYYGNYSGLDYGGGWFNSDYKKLRTIKSAKTTSASFDIKSAKVYKYCVRAYRKSGKEKVYSEYSQCVSSDSNMALLNGIKLKKISTGLGEYDLGLVKSAVKQCVTDDMSNAEKALAVYNYVHNAATYEYDISKVSLDSIKAILVDHAGQCYQYAVTYQAMMKYLGFDMKLIGGKTASGGPHWWNEMNLNGTARMFDPQVGGRFCIYYEQLGSRMVTKEKTVD